MAREKEQIICRICHESWLISESQLCGCGTRLYTSLEIMTQISELRSKMTTLSIEIAEKEGELFWRKRRRIEVDESGQLNVRDIFFENVHGVPHSMRPAAKAAKAAKPKTEITARQLAEYD